ncbi:ABC transporter permease [Paenibacillus hamazuiensis]|uniref:ABC transporter permease n=1 Tax=Paenibacillus hamazuiensis TaxID=2936508 RepID=UPI00200E93D9|nr:ABC transporter permease [Paenibacillus hamazuiensis]
MTEHSRWTTQLTAKVLTDYMRAQRREIWKVRTTQSVIVALFLALWEIAGRLNWIDVLLFSYPSKIAALLKDKLLDGSLLVHSQVTLWETIVGFVFGTLLGTLIATIIWWSPFLSKVLDPFIVVLNSLPKVALGPLFIVALGPGVISIIATTLSLTVVITTLVVYNSFKEVDPNFVKVIRVFGGTKADTFRKVILPASYPTIVSTLKVNVGLSWVGVIVGEFLVSKYGLGYLIIYGFQVFNFTLVLGSLFIIAVFATLMYEGVAYIERRMFRRK